MIEIKQDILNIKLEKYEALVITTNNVVKSNGELVMGAGIAKLAKEKWPDLPQYWGACLRYKQKESPYIDTYHCDGEYHNLMYIPDECFDNVNIKVTGYIVLALQTKRHWKDKSDINLIIRSCIKLKEFADRVKLNKVYMTRPGCGNGGLNWNKVKEAISFLDERFIICHVEL